MVWQLYLTERALHGITISVCAVSGRTAQLYYMKTPRDKNLPLNPSENKWPVYLLEEYVATVGGTQGSRTGIKLFMCAGSGRCPFMGCAHSMRPPLSILIMRFFSWWQFLRCTTPVHKVNVLRQWQNTWVRKGTRIVRKNLFLFHSVALCLRCSTMHVWDSSLAFGLHWAAAYFFLSHCHNRLGREKNVCYKFPLGWTKTPVHLSGNSLQLHCVIVLALVTSSLFSIKSVFYQVLNFYSFYNFNKIPTSTTYLSAKYRVEYDSCTLTRQSKRGEK